MRKTQILTSLSSLALIGGLYSTTIVAQAEEAIQEEIALEEVVSLGTRVKGRTATASAVPVDVLKGSDIHNQSSNDLSDMLRNVVPSYNVSAQPISDAGTFVRPASLRGLAADHTLLLMNGKRRHRSSIILFYTAGDSTGAQPTDISVIPSIALKQVEVLRDGAAAQYGSDAIAGVLNLSLKDSNEGATLEAKWGSTMSGDGDNFQVAGNVGMPFTDNGFANLSFTYSEADPTDRSVQRDDAAGLIAAGNTDVPIPAQVWGAPTIHSDFKFVANVGVDLAENQSFYAFGNYANKRAEGGLYYRNPNGRTGVYTDGAGNALLADLDGVGVGVACPTFAGGDAAGLAAVSANTAVGDNCFAFNEIFPGGFTPTLEGVVTDMSAVTGVKGELDSGLGYDVSFGAGMNQVAFTVNSINTSYGPDTPLRMDAGTFRQIEQNFNLDLTYPVAVDVFASDLNVAGGFEWRKETYEAKSGAVQSYAQGPYADQGFSGGSQGYVGTSNVDAGKWSRSNIAVYLDVEAQVTETLLLAVAGRWEDFDGFGSTTNGKVSARWDVLENIAFRGSVSTGFRAPTPGQSNTSNTSSVFTANGLVFSGIIPSTDAIAVALGGKELTPETSTNYSIGAVLTAADLTVTVDYFRIDVEDRITLSSFFDAPTGSAFDNIRYYTNDFKTKTQGIDVVATYPLDLFDGNTDINAVFNWTDTKVISSSSGLLDGVRVQTLEDGLPAIRGNASITHYQGDFRFLARVNYYGDYFHAHASYFENNPGAEITLDLEIGYNISDSISIVAGASNLFNNFPDELPAFGSILGSKYPEFSPMGVNGGSYYFRLRYEM